MFHSVQLDYQSTCDCLAFSLHFFSDHRLGHSEFVAGPLNMQVHKVKKKIRCWVFYLRRARVFLSTLLGSSIHLSFFSLALDKSVYVWETRLLSKKNYTVQAETQTHDDSHIGLRRKQALFWGFTLKIYREEEKNNNSSFILFSTLSYTAWNEIKKHCRKKLLRLWDLIQFEISMKATGNIFKALFESLDGYL